MNIFKRVIVTLLLVSVFVIMIPIPDSASASGTIAWGAANINGNGVRIRSGPGLNNEVLNHANTGDIVVVIERTSNEWYKVNFHGTVGFISVPFLENSREAANFNKRGSVSGNNVNMRAKPDTTSSVLASYSTGTEMNIIGINSGWYKVVHGGNTGYIRSDLMTVLSGGSSASSNPAPSKGQQIADFAVGFVGYSYRWGKASPSEGFDCSGLVTYVMRQHGISVTRYSAGQYRDNGTHVDKANLQPGDLVFFRRNGAGSVNHVGIYIGNGRFVHSSNARTGVIISDLNTSNNVRTWAGAKRVV